MLPVLDERAVTETAGLLILLEDEQLILSNNSELTTGWSGFCLRCFPLRQPSITPHPPNPVRAFQGGTYLAVNRTGCMDDAGLGQQLRGKGTGQHLIRQLILISGQKLCSTNVIMVLHPKRDAHLAWRCTPHCPLSQQPFHSVGEHRGSMREDGMSEPEYILAKDAAAVWNGGGKG